MMNRITRIANLIGSDTEALKAELEKMMQEDIPHAPCVEPDALRLAHTLLEHYAFCMAEKKIRSSQDHSSMTSQMGEEKPISDETYDETYCENVLDIAMILLIVAAGGWEALK